MRVAQARSKLLHSAPNARDVTSAMSSSSSSIPLHHASTSSKQAYRNPWTDQPSTPSTSIGFNYADWLNTARTKALSLPTLEWARVHPASARVRPVKVVKPDFTPPTAGHLKATWLGHAVRFLEQIACIAEPRLQGYLVQFPHVESSVVFDPMFSERAGPAQAGYAVGPARYAPPPCAVQDLPDDIRFVCISHNQYVLLFIWGGHTRSDLHHVLTSGELSVHTLAGLTVRGLLRGGHCDFPT